jgi:thiamine-phosphate pyrophosphorylase
MAPDVDYSLYAILDAARIADRDPLRLAEAVCDGGATIVQYREKGARFPVDRERLADIRRCLATRGIPFLINDDLDLALRLGADGVHLGQGDLPVREARVRGGRDLLVGVTVHDSAEASAAVSAGADYLSVGSIYFTATKPDIRIVGPARLGEICGLSPLPTVAIGGIDEARVAEVLSRGAAGVALVSALLDADDPREATRRIRERIDSFRRRGNPPVGTGEG